MHYVCIFVIAIEFFKTNFLFSFSDTRYTGPFNTHGASNILLIVVMIIISIAFIVFALIFGKKFIIIFCKGNGLPRHTPSPSNELNNRSRSRPHPQQTAADINREPSEETPALTNRDESDELPSAPPSYEEVIKENPGILARGVPTAPPSYTESCSTTTTQV